MDIASPCRTFERKQETLKAFRIGCLFLCNRARMAMETIQMRYSRNSIWIYSIKFLVEERLILDPRSQVAIRSEIYQDESTPLVPSLQKGLITSTTLLHKPRSWSRCCSQVIQSTRFTWAIRVSAVPSALHAFRKEVGYVKIRQRSSGIIS